MPEPTLVRLPPLRTPVNWVEALFPPACRAMAAAAVSLMAILPLPARPPKLKVPMPDEKIRPLVGTLSVTVLPCTA